MLTQTVQPEPATSQSANALGALNAVTLNASQVEAALRVIAALPSDLQSNPIAQGLVLQSYARELALGDEALVAAALHARVVALEKWLALHDPERQSNGQALIEASARYALCEIGDGIGFEPAGFQEMVLFIEELPW